MSRKRKKRKRDLSYNPKGEILYIVLIRRIAQPGFPLPKSKIQNHENEASTYLYIDAI